MKAFGLIAVLVFVAGCAPITTMEQLELEAALTGDWSEVEKRERSLTQRGKGNSIDCPVGYTSVCQKFSNREACGCVTRQALREVFAQR